MKKVYKYILLIMYIAAVFFVTNHPLAYSEFMTLRFNWIPFKFAGLIYNYVHSFISAGKSVNMDYLFYYSYNCTRGFILNLIMFIPFGVLSGLFMSRKIKNLKQIALASFLFSLSIELFQLITMLIKVSGPGRVFDVDDLIANTIGGIIGFLLFRLFIRCARKSKKAETT